MRQDRNRRIRALECLAKRKHDPPKLTVIKPGDGWAYLYWGSRLVKVLREDLNDAI